MKIKVLTTKRQAILAAEMFKVFSFFLLLCFSSFIKIPLFFTPVPVTMQTFVVFLAALFLRPVQASGAVALYILAGIFGAPFFANAGWGIPYLLGPTGGYLLGFLAAAALMSALLPKAVSFVAKFCVMTFGIAVIYLCGSLWLWLGYKMGPGQVFLLGMAPFMLPDAFKAAAAILINEKLRGKSY